MHPSWSGMNSVRAQHASTPHALEVALEFALLCSCHRCGALLRVLVKAGVLKLDSSLSCKQK